MSDAENGGALGGAQRLKRWLRPLMLAITAVFVVLSALDLSRRWESRRVTVDAWFLFASLLPVLACCVLQGVAWIALTERMAHKRTPRFVALCLYFESQLARYTPGKVGLPLVRMEGAPALGVSRRLVGISVLIETLSWVATGLVAGFFFLRVAGAPDAGLGKLMGRFSSLLFAVSLILPVLLVAVDRKYAPQKIKNTLGIEGTGPLAPLRLPLIHVVYWAGWAVHGYYLARALGASPHGALVTMGFSPLANVLGFAALAAPAGVGVREAVLLSGLSPVLGGPGAVGAAVLSRVVSLIADLATLLVARRWR